MPFRNLLAVAIFVALAGCGQPAEKLPQKPQLLLDRDSTDAGLQFGSAYIGTKPQESLLVGNRGLDTLTIENVSLVGSTEITMDPPASLTVKGNDHTFIRVFFEPKAEKDYSATLTITSNAENYPQKVLIVTGHGTKALTDGGSPDGG
jgi:hypothetical protein